MKLRSLLCSLFAAALLSGCTNIAVQNLPIQQILNATLPPTFEGNFHLDHANPYVQIADLDFTGLKKVGDVWTWTGMIYKGHSAFTSTNVVLTPNK